MLWSVIKPGFLSPLVDAVFPPRCPLCGASISDQNGLCSSCWNRLEIPGEPCCAQCQRPFSDGMTSDAICAPCMADPPRHDGIAAATLYNEASRGLVLAFKYGRRIGLARLLSRLIAAKLPHVDETWIIVPVPLHRWRLWRRGFNQAALLARDLAGGLGATVLVDALKRQKQTPALGRLGRKARARVLSGAIVGTKHRKDQLIGAKIVLVDDVLTSGATSDACVAALKRAGAKTVIVACFARVLEEAKYVSRA